MSIIAKFLHNSISKSLLKTDCFPKIISASFAIDYFRKAPISNINYKTIQKPLLLQSQILNANIQQQKRTYKQKLRLRQRCKNCYFIWRNGRLYVECPEHPRHKQHHVNSFLKGFDKIPNGYIKESI